MAAATAQAATKASTTSTSEFLVILILQLLPEGERGEGGAVILQTANLPTFLPSTFLQHLSQLIEMLWNNLEHIIQSQRHVAKT